MSDFRTLPDGPLTLANVAVPGCLIGRSEPLVRFDMHVSDGVISATPGTRVDMAGRIVLPAFTDMHTHIDKGHIWPRAANPDGTFLGALTTVANDRSAKWSAEDVHTRATFSLKCAYAHGTRALRTHIDSLPPQDGISWPVFERLREEWEGRITLQGASLVGCDTFENIKTDYAATADIVATHGGILGMVSYPVPDVATRIRDLLDLAGARGLSVDFHADETMDPTSETLREIAEAVLETGFDAPVVVGHCCSLSTQEPDRYLDTLDLVAKAGLSLVSLPMCNLYLQDRDPGRTPRNRGITLVHEAKARGIPMAFASDNTRDPFYAYGDLDMLEVLRQSFRIGHLDHSDPDWIDAVLGVPSRACGFPLPSLTNGAPADLILFNARDWTELFARPQSDRIVLRAGRAIDRTLPAYSDLDHLMEPA